MDLEQVERRLGVIPDSPAGRQLGWYLRVLTSAGESASRADEARYAPGLPSAAPIPRGDGDLREAWRRWSSQIGPFDVTSVDEAADFSVAVTLRAADGKRWRVSCTAEAEAPHRITALDWQRAFDSEVVVREATEADAAVLSDIERRCPIVLDDTSVVVDRGDDYFAFARLMEDVTVSLGFVDGDPAGINCGAVRRVRVGGAEYRMMVAVHLRILPQHQRKGLWGALSRLLGEKYPLDGDGWISCGYVSTDNAAMQRGFAHHPNKWSVRALRAHLDCASLEGPSAGRPATPDDAPRIVEILNSCHGDEEMYLPYTVESLTARLERSPAQYSWERVWLSDRAAVGVWPAGESIRLISESGGVQSVSRRGLVLDYGFLPGAEDELEGLLRAWCAWLAERELDTLSIFTSAPSPGCSRIRPLARELEAFDVFPGAPEPEGAAQRGLYVDHVYF